MDTPSRPPPPPSAPPLQPAQQVPLLTRAQISSFKRDGFIILEGVLDPQLCKMVRDNMWDTITDHLPRMKRNDPATWHVTEEEAE
eukprot:COSAG05_NODE_10623_length_555_cov_0.780702_1_plen_84_part_10